MSKQDIEIVRNSQKRQDIVARAYDVFYRHGFHATGVDRLLADSGISKRTMYKYFRSKEELIAATIRHYTDLIGAEAAGVMERAGGDPVAKLLALFDWRRDILASGDFSGCFSINAKLEYEGKHEEIESACVTFMAGLEQNVLALCREANLTDPEKAARQLMILLKGTIVLGQARRDPQVAVEARDAAETLIAAFRRK